ncbi:hypothetical protein N7457_000360 [Penicillium paradoxum]|uniref:uncharacterized protein n=1 Tax=Penicillium paradoxum TaxID=176176 RepID=UPI0025480317|nr:uncharacterized protein N7457_000360 [Penicillium paradoxum]KAJ5793761.1 hypothetical protein N7457_000360 [Penicillium paradoxum]
MSVDPRSYLSRELPQSTTELVFPVTSLISLSLLSLVLIHRYIKYRCRRAHLPVLDTKQDVENKDQSPWLASTMEKGDIATFSSLPLSACDILRPLSHTIPLPSSGALAAMAREEQARRLPSGSNPASTDALPVADESVHKHNESIEQMRHEDIEGVRTWKRVVVEYR